jgi:hypothetical protein
LGCEFLLLIGATIFSYSVYATLTAATLIFTYLHVQCDCPGIRISALQFLKES